MHPATSYFGYRSPQRYAFSGLGVDVYTEPVAGRFYQVVAGDTLSGTKNGIAQKCYGDYKKWRQIFNHAYNQKNYFLKYNKTSDQLDKVGSPLAYPIFFIPLTSDPNEPVPVDVQGIPGKPGDPGKQGPPGVGVKGDKGDPGSPGPQGPPPPPDVVNKAVSEYFAQNPVKGATPIPGPEGKQGLPGIGTPGAKGDKGDKGDPGKQGTQGPPPPPDVVNKAVSEYFAKNPVKGVTPVPGPQGPGPTSEQVSASVTDYFAKNPSKGGSPGPKGDKGDPGVPGSPPPPDVVNKAVSEYFAKNPVKGGGVSVPGPQGVPGIPGAPGASPTPEQVRAIVEAELAKNPPSAGGPISTASMAGDISPVMMLPLILIAAGIASQGRATR